MKPTGRHIAQSDTYSVSDRDRHILAVAGHGIDPEPLLLTGRHLRKEMQAIRDSAWRDLLFWCVLPITIMILLRVFFFGLYVIPSGSMLDTINIGDRVVTSSLSSKNLQRGDIIVFKDPANWLSEEDLSSGFLIKRLIGLPGDTVACKGAGYPITVNGVAVDESSYLRPGVDPSSFAFSMKVSAGHLFVLGDNRANSADSRYHTNDGDGGLVPISDVEGVAIFRYWPITRIGVLDSHHEVFEHVPSGE
ncbi:MAG: signal peptidase I [Bifidobacteriaceae bacterium]|nr:signal peptidase I [Bifidobacteriaceae bacterium]